MKIRFVSSILLALVFLCACEKTEIERAGISISSDLPKVQLEMIHMMPSTPLDYAAVAKEKNFKRLFAYRDAEGLHIPGVPKGQEETYAVSFGVMMMPGMAGAEDENHKRLQKYFLEYSQVYNEEIIKHKFIQDSFK